MADLPDPLTLPSEIAAHYGSGYEAARLQGGRSRLEATRTRLILERFLPPAPARILDIGGGPGAYAAWLARAGYDVRLLDAVPLHVAQATEASSRQPDFPFAAEVGDARALPYADAAADTVLFLGPLYHLTDRNDRLQALSEARRVLCPGGLVVAAVISRFASLFDGLYGGLLLDPAFVGIVEQDLRDGQHRNPDNHPAYFTTAYFHHPAEIAGELEEAGFALDCVCAVEGPGSLVPDLDGWWNDVQRRSRLLSAIAAVEREPSLLGLSTHLIAVGRRDDTEPRI